MKLCDYGCGQEAKYQFKNGKWCCENNQSKCPVIKEKIRHYAIGRKDSEETKKKKSNSLKGSLNPNYGKTWKDSEETKKKKSIANKGNIPWNKNEKDYFTKEQLENQSKKIKNLWNNPNSKYNSTSYRKNLSNGIKKAYKDPTNKINIKLTIEKINEKYPFFSKIEEMRYNPNKPEEKEIQVRCKNHECENSKEKGGWFTPTFTQIQSRKNQLEKIDGNDGSYFYCCRECKDTCILFGLQNDPYKNNTPLPYTPVEIQTHNKFVLDRENGLCEYCGDPAEHVHHVRPKKLEPFFALDPDFGVAVCRKCHYKYGHQNECSTGNLAKIVCSVESQKFLNQK